MNTKNKAQNMHEANADKVYKITEKDLPVCCPMPDMIIWNSHPKVYLPIDKSNPKEICPYCGAKFELQ